MKVLSIPRIRFGAYEFDRVNRMLSRDGVELQLPPRAVGVLSCLLDHPGQILSKQALLEEVWKEANVTETSLTEAVSLLRQLLSDDPQRPLFIQTVPRRGYRFVAPLTLVDDEQAGVATVAGESSSGDLSSASLLAGMPPGRSVAGALALTEASVGNASLAADPLATEASGIFPGAADFSTAASPAAAYSHATSAAAEPIWPAWLPWLFFIVSALTLAGIIASIVQQPSTYVRPVVRFAIDVPAELQLPLDGPSLALSRDGRRVAFVATRADSPPRLYVRDMDRLDPIVLEGSEGAAAPFFSPDGRWVGFFANGALRKIPVGGGPIVTLCPARAAFGASWSTRHTIVFASSVTGGLSRVDEDGGPPTVLTTPDASTGEVRHAWPELLPDDSGVLFTGVPLAGGPEASRIAAITFDSGRVQTLVDGATSPHATPTGHLLFARGATMMAAPFDPQTIELLGPAVPVLDGLATDDTTGIAQFAVAPGGHIAAVRLARPETMAMWRWVDLSDGSVASPPGATPTATLVEHRQQTAADVQPTRRDAAALRPPLSPSVVTVPFPSSAIRGWSLSRDARRLGLVFGDGHRTDLWLSDLLQGGMHRFTNDGQNVAPLWSLDGRRIIYASRRDGPFNLFVRTLDEAAMSSSRIQDSPRQQLPTDISADGIVYVDAHPRTGLDLWLLPWSGTASPSSAIAPSSSSSSTSAQSTSASSTPASSASAAPVPLVQTPFDETNGTISPDGRWLAWQSNESGHWEVTLRTRSAANAAPAGGAGDVRVGPSDGARIAWTPDSRALLFTHAGRLMMAPLASPDDTPATATAAADTRAPHIVATGVDARSEFAVAADGRVLVRTRDTEADAAATRIEVVLDWSRELSAKVPIRPRTPRPVR